MHDCLGERRPDDRVHPHPRDPRATPEDDVVIRERHDGDLLADPDPFELAVGAQALVPVAQGSRGSQELLESLVEIERGVMEERLEETAARIGIVGAPAVHEDMCMVSHCVRLLEIGRGRQQSHVDADRVELSGDL